MKWDSSDASSQIIMTAAINHGVHDVVCSPGSRNAPLLIAAASRPELKKHVIADERAAAFYALGLALVSRTPVMLVCTSGSAVLNYAPAVAEAFYRNVPLIIVSADRPAEWIDQDDSQTIRQSEVLKNFIKKSFDIPVAPVDAEDRKNFRWFCNRILNDAILTAIRNRKGPVHINVQLSQPLTDIISAPEYSSISTRCITEIFPEDKIPTESIRELTRRAVNKKIMLVIGFHTPDKRLNRAVNEFGKLKNVVVMAETLSNIHSSDDWASVDSAICMADASMHPDIIISAGGALVSRKLKEFLRDAEGVEHWSLGHTELIADCFKSMNIRINIDPASFLLRLASLLRRETKNLSTTTENYSDNWEKIRMKSREYFEDYLKQIPWSDLAVFDMLFKAIPSSWNLFLSNGTPVRYAQLFKRDFHASYCNRGVSGIDGCTSTAIGGASATNVPTALITGDLSFLYDVGALGIPGANTSGMIIFVIRNGGGAIFRFIDSTAKLEEEILDNYFCAAPNTDISSLAHAYGFDYIKITERDSEERISRLRDVSCQERQKSVIVECITNGSISAEVLRGYFTLLKQQKRIDS